MGTELYINQRDGVVEAAMVTWVPLHMPFHLRLYLRAWRAAALGMKACLVQGA